MAKKIEDITGINVAGFKVAIEARQIEHILKDHGENGKTYHSMADDNDIAKIEYIIKNADAIEASGKTRAYTYSKDGYNKTADTIKYEKSIGKRTYYAVQAVADTKAKTLYIVTAYMANTGAKKEVSQLTDTNSPSATPENGSVVTSNDSIHSNDDSVNSNDMQITEKNLTDSNEDIDISPKFEAKIGFTEPSSQEIYRPMSNEDEIKAIVTGRKTIKQRQVEAVSSKFGLEIVWDKKVSRGTYDPDRKAIRLNPNTTVTGAYVEIFKHEFTHYLQRFEGYGKFKDYLFNKNDTFDRYVRGKIKNATGENFTGSRANALKTYTEIYLKERQNNKKIPQRIRDNYNEEKIEREIVADFIGEYLLLENGNQSWQKTEEFLKNLKKTDKGIFVRLIEWIREKIALLRAEPQNRSLVADLRKIEKKLIEVYNTEEKTTDIDVDEMWSISLSGDQSNPESKDILKAIHENLQLIPKENKFDVKNPNPIIEGKKKSVYALDIFNSQGNTAYNPDIGTVELVKSGAKSTMMHGFGNTKLAAVEAIKPVIENGVIISYIQNYNNTGVDRYIISAKGKIGNDDAYVGVIVKSYPRKNENSKFYLHEAEIIKAGPSLLTASVDTVDVPANLTIPQGDSKSQDYSMQGNKNHSSKEQYSVKTLNPLSDTESFAEELLTENNSTADKTQIEDKLNGASESIIKGDYATAFANTKQIAEEILGGSNFEGNVSEKADSLASEILNLVLSEMEGTRNEELKVAMRAIKTDTATFAEFEEKKRHHITMAERNYITDVANRLGIEVVFEDMYETAKKNGQDFKELPDGYIDGNGKMHIGFTVTDPINFIFKHEITHYAENGQKYKDFANAVKSSSVYEKWIATKIKSEGSIASKSAKYRQIIINNYKRNGIELSVADAEREIIANFVGEMLFKEDGSGLKAITANMSSKQKKGFIQYIKNFIAYIKSKLQGNKTASRKVRRLEKMFNESLSSVKKSHSTNRSTGIEFSFAIEKYPYDMQKVIEGYIESTDSDFVNFIKNAKNETNSKRLSWMHYDLVNNLDKKNLGKAKEILGYDISDYGVSINGEAIHHIEYRHGKNGKQDSSMKDDNDLARVQFIIDNADDVSIAINASGEIRYDSQYRDKNNKPSKVFLITKKINGTYYIAVAAPDAAKKIIHIKSSYISKKGIKKEGNQEVDANSPNLTPETNLDIPSKISIPKSQKNVNKKFSIPDSQSALLDKYESGEISREQYLEETSINWKNELTNSIENYTETDYNNFGWVRANNVLSASDYNQFTSYFADHKIHNHYYVRTRYGDSIIPVGKDLNILVYAKGDIDSPKISKVVRINLNDEYNISEVRSDILESERQGDYQPYQLIETYYGEGIFERFQNRDFSTFRELQRERERNESATDNPNNRTEQDGRGSTTEDNGNDGIKFSIPDSQSALLDRYESGEISREQYLEETSINWKNELTNSIENYTETDYNNFGWVRANNVLSASDYNQFTSYFADHKIHNHYYVRTRYGESIIPVGKDLNILVYAKGDIDSPKISKVIRINENNEYLISEIRSDILDCERKNFYNTSQYVENLYGEGLLRTDYVKDFPTLQELKPEREREIGVKDNPNNRTEQNGRGSTTEDNGNDGIKFSIPDSQSALLDRYESGEISREQYLEETSINWKKAGKDFGIMPTGEKAVVNAAVPEAVEKNKDTRQFVRTIIETGELPNNTVESFTEEILLGNFSYEPISDKKAEQKANKIISDHQGRNTWNTAVNSSKFITKEDIAVGEKLLLKAIEDKNTKRTLELSAELSEVSFHQRCHSERSEESFQLVRPLGFARGDESDSRCQMSDFRRRSSPPPYDTNSCHSDERSEEESFPIGKILRQDLSTTLKVTLSARGDL